jgi:hypothetical protein
VEQDEAEYMCRFDRLRSLSYADTHVVMVCFSVRPPFPFPIPLALTVVLFRWNVQSRWRTSKPSGYRKYVPLAFPHRISVLMKNR